MVKCLTYVTCRRCGAKISHHDITLAEGEEFDIVARTVAKCAACQKEEGRTTNGPNRKLRPS